MMLLARVDDNITRSRGAKPLVWKVAEGLCFDEEETSRLIDVGLGCFP